MQSRASRWPIIPLLKLSFFNWQRHRCGAWSAALAFFAVISFAPFLMSLYLIATTIFGREKVLADLLPTAQNRLGPKGAEFFAYLAERFSKELHWGGGLALLGAAAMAWGAASYFRHLREALEIVWGSPNAVPGFVEILKQKIYGATLAFFYAQIYLVSLLIRVKLDIPTHGPEAPWHFLVASADMLVFFALQSILAFLLYRYFAPVPVPWREAFWGAMITGALQTLARIACASILAHEDMTSLGGLAGGIVMLLIWLNFANQVFLFGAEVTHQMMRQRQNGN